MEETLKENKRICLCGCGNEVISRSNRKANIESVRFCIGHRRNRLRDYEYKVSVCACGCGESIPFVSYRGERQFKHGHNSRHGNRANENNGQWKGGQVINDHGYIEIRSVGHRRAHKPGYYVAEHVLVMERHLNACLCDWSIVHHINEVKTDNRIKNLMVFTSNGQHHSHHHMQRRVSRALYHLFQ